MSQLYVCKEYETPYEEGYRVVRTIEEHNKIIYNQALEDFLKKCLDENIQFYLDPIDCMREVKEQLKK